MVINHLLTGMILQVICIYQSYPSPAAFLNTSGVLFSQDVEEEYSYESQHDRRKKRRGTGDKIEGEWRGSWYFYVFFAPKSGKNIFT